MLSLIIVSFIAGLLTVLAPCILPLLPIIVGGSLSDLRSRLKPYVITASLAISVIVFTLILKVSTDLLAIPQSFWQSLSGGILIVFSLTMIFPGLWARLAHKSGAEKKSNTWLAQASKKESFVGDILLGSALGPVFTTCSPTYFVIIATVLPQSFGVGLINLIAFALGLASILLAIALIGQRFVGKINSLSDPNGWFKKTIGILFLIVGIAIITGLDKQFETLILDLGLTPVINIENSLLDSIGIEQ
jgi:cytochrome c biogenesis protein CcdA